MRGLSLIEALVALMITAMVLVFFVGILFQTDKGHQALDALKENAIGRDDPISRFLRAKLESIALVPKPGNPRSVDFTITPLELTFVTRLMPPGPRRGLHKVSVASVSPDEVEITLDQWPDGGRAETMRFPGKQLAFRTDERPPAFAGVPRAVFVELDGRQYRFDLGSTVPPDCILQLSEATSILQCPGFDG